MAPSRTEHLSLLLSSPRVAPGLLSAAAWSTLHDASVVLAADPDSPQARAIAAAGVPVEQTDLPDRTPQTLAAHLLELTSEHGTVVWIGSPDGDPGLAEALAVTMPQDDPPTLELLVGSWDVPGARLLDAVAVMDRLRSPGGCPWDARQDHASLTPYLIEEAHEAAEVLERLDDTDDLALREDATDELGDVLLQVLFHARVAADHDQDPFDIDDVAAGLVAKLVRRHPHVFADVAADTPEAVEANWDQIKAAERADGGKPARAHLLDGIPSGMPPLARAAKVASRVRRAGREEWLRDWIEARIADRDPGALLLETALDLHDGDVDASAAMRHTLRDLQTAARDLDRDD
ncbi:MazG family protein [Ornithinimicrobium sp. Y1847]|uniref:MazG family protein n=1 Tax=unclassified Ornithinimicrobium TaxID=2615080 RepID=UPI003B67C3D9